MTANKTDPTNVPHHNRFVGIRNRFIAGILFATPIIATIWIFNFFLNLATAWFPQKYFPTLAGMAHGYLLKFLVLISLVIALFLLGELTFLIGKRMRHFVDNLFKTIPIISTIYSFIKKFTDWIGDRQATPFHSVVLVQYPCKGSYALGLITADTPSFISSYIKDENGNPLECINVFIATTPNPTSGFFLIYPKREAIFLGMDVATAMNLVVSAGAILPDSKTKELQAAAQK